MIDNLNSNPQSILDIPYTFEQISDGQGSKVIKKRISVWLETYGIEALTDTALLEVTKDKEMVLGDFYLMVDRDNVNRQKYLMYLTHIGTNVNDEPYYIFYYISTNTSAKFLSLQSREALITSFLDYNNQGRWDRYSDTLERILDWSNVYRFETPAIKFPFINWNQDPLKNIK